MHLAGVVEGFYGRPWSAEERLHVMRECGQRGMTHYLYAPKNDPKHRQRWRDPYEAAELEGFRRLVDEGAMSVGFAVSPGLSIDYADGDDRKVLLAKLMNLAELGADLLCLAFDDIPFRPGLGEAQADLCRWVASEVGHDITLLVVPTDYVNVEATPYSSALADGLPPDALVAWTGVAVVNDEITADQARRRADALSGRPPVLWDNYPVNDAVMADRLFLGPLRGRDPGLLDHDACAGYLANPMTQPRASLLPLASTAAWLAGHDPEAAWVREAEAQDARVFAEACDGDVPRTLVDDYTRCNGDHSDAIQRLRTWLEAAAACEAPGLEGEVEAWLEQVRAEASVGLAMVRAATTGSDVDLLGGFGMALVQWLALARAPVTVMGPRRSFRPVVGQTKSGDWELRPGALSENVNAVDALVRHVLARLSRPSRA